MQFNNKEYEKEFENFATLRARCYYLISKVISNK